MTLKELARLINSPTLERDLQYLNGKEKQPHVREEIPYTAWLKKAKL